MPLTRASSKADASTGWVDVIYIARPWVMHAVQILMIGLAVLLLALALLAYAWPIVRHPAAALLLVIAWFPLCAASQLFFRGGDWVLYDHVTAPDGKTYWFIDSSFLQAQIMVLAWQEGGNWFYTRYRSVGCTNGDSPRFYASLIRRQKPSARVEDQMNSDPIVPSSAAAVPEPNDEYGRLALVNDETIYGLRNRGQCYFSYDIGCRDFVRQYDILELSPFVLLGEHDEPWKDDVDAIKKWLNEQSNEVTGVPGRGALVAGLAHPNPKVRELAKELMSLWDMRFSAVQNADASSTSSTSGVIPMPPSLSTGAY